MSAEPNKASRNRLTLHSLKFFEGEGLFNRLGRAVCRAQCLPRKEFFETWEVVKRVRRRFRDRPIFELAAGHGFLSLLMVLLEEGIPSATCVDVRKPPSHERLRAGLSVEWPRLAGCVNYEQQPIEGVEIAPGSLVVSVHACGGLTDRVLDRALAVRAGVAVLPCCHDLDESDDGGLTGWMEGTLAIDAARAARLHSAGYRVLTTTIPEEITPRNRLLMGWPLD